MSEFENQEIVQNKNRKQAASWAAGIFTLLGLTFLGLSVYIIFVIQDGRFDLSDQVLMPVAGLMFLLSLASFVLIRRNRMVLGTGILFGVSLLPPIVASLVLTESLLVSIFFVALLAPILIIFILPRKSRRWTIIASVITVLIMVAIDFWDPAFRVSSTILPNFTYVILPLIVLGFLGFFVRQAIVGNIRTRLIFSFILIALVPLAVVAVATALRTFNTQEIQALEVQNQVAKLAAQQVETFIREREKELQRLTDVSGLSELSLEEQNNLLFSLFTSQNLYEELVLVDHNGQEKIHLSRLEIYTTEDLTSRAGTPEFDRPKETDETYFSSVFFGELTGEPFMTIAVPLFNLRTGELTNSIIANFRFKAVWNIVADADVVGSGIVYMVDDQNRVVAHPNPSIVLLGTQVNLPTENTFTTGLNGSEVALSWQSISLNEQTFYVVAEQPSSEALALAQSNLTITIAISIGMLALAAVVGTIASRFITNPINELAKAAKSISEGDLSQQVDIKSKDEIGLLATAFNSMTAQLSELITSLEQQVADRTRALETSTAVSRRLSTILDQDQLVREVVEQLRSAFGYYHAHIYLYDAAKQNLEMAGGTGEAGRTMLARGHKIEKGRGLVGRAAETNQVVLIPDVSQAEGWLPNPLLPDTKAEVAVPIAIGPDVLGVLDVQHNVVNGLTEQDSDLIQAIANQVGIAVQNAQAYQRAQRQAEREARIVAINQHIQAATSIDEVLKVAVSELGEALGARRSNIDLKVNASSQDGHK